MLRITATLLAAASIPLSGAEDPAGVVVEEAGPGFAAAVAGLEAGDVLLRWERGVDPPADPEPAGEVIRQPFDLWLVEVEQAPRGVVTLHGKRAGEALAVTVPPGEWRLRVRPQLPTEPLRIDAAARQLAATQDPREAREAVELWAGAAAALAVDAPLAAGWLRFEIAQLELRHGLGDGGEGSFRRALALLEGEGRSAWRAELCRRWGRALQGRSRWDRAEGLYRQALSVAGGESLAAAASFHNLGLVAKSRGRLAEAEEHHRRALAIREALAPASLEVAASLNHLGNAALARGDLPLASGYYDRSLAIRESLAPGGLDVAASLYNLGRVAWRRGDLEVAEDYFQRCLGIETERAPGSLEVAASLNNLGGLASDRGDLAAAESDHRRSLAIRERLAPESLAVAESLNNLGIVAWKRGDLAAAEDYYRRSLALQESLAPGSPVVATSLSNAGVLAWSRGDLEAAEGYHQRSLAIRQQLAPEGIDVAASLNNLAIVAVDRGDLASAEGYQQRSLAIRERLAPESLAVAESLNNLGVVAQERGDLAVGEAYYRRSLALWAELAPDSLLVAQSLHALGIVARERGDLPHARELLRRALGLRASLAPGSWWEAETLYEMASVHRELRQPGQALGLLRRALAALELQAGRLGGDRERRGSFFARFGGYYRDAARLLIERGESAEAFRVLERSRARGLLAMLAERDLLFTDLPEDLRRERLAANAEHDRILDRLGGWNASRDEADEEKEELLRRLGAARRRQREIEVRLRAASPRLAALQYPEPLDLEATREALDPGTLLLAYAIGEEESDLFVVGRGKDGFAALPLDTDRESLTRDVERFRRLWGPGAQRESWIRGEATRLTASLLAPAAGRIAEAERLVILPDGPLHYLPFAALADPANGASFGYLVQSKPVSVVASATLFAQLKESRREVAEPRIAAFADPLYPRGTLEGEGAEPVWRSVVHDGLELPSLPGARAEAAALERLYRGASEVYLGAEAREETAKSVGERPTILHFATHGLIDDRQPLSSALALSIPEVWQSGQDNGLLQAWEIFEQVRIDADLVTLSACETALGQEGGGEGLLGLTRAFQYAGARTVLASLWAVSDESTAALMERFYRHLRSGKSKDQALRYAQLELLAAPIVVEEGEVRQDFTHPFFWAPFQVIGDWK